MSKAQELAAELVEAVEGFPQPTKLESEAANLLRTQDALLRQALEALEWSLPKDGGAITYDEVIYTIKEHLK